MNETPFSIPFFSVVLLQVLFVLLTYSLYKTTRQIPLRSSEQNRLRLWNLLLSLGSALIFSLICALAAPGEGLNSFLYALSQPVWYGLGLMASVFVMAPKVRYSARTLWSFYGQPLRILSLPCPRKRSSEMRTGKTGGITLKRPGFRRFFPALFCWRSAGLAAW